MPAGWPPPWSRWSATSPPPRTWCRTRSRPCSTHWPSEGIPERPDGWLYTVARRRGLDLLRREHRRRDKLALVTWPARPEPDDRLRLIFTCCHPALSHSAQVALTLRVVCGLTTARIAKAFLVPESTVGQRITRAKRKITQAGIPYRLPSPDDLGARLTEVLAVIYLLCNEGHLSGGGDNVLVVAGLPAGCGPAIAGTAEKLTP